MYALVEDSTITRTYNNPRGMTIGGVQYPQNIHSLWSESDLNAIGIYSVVEDNTNKKDEKWYINTNQTLAFAGGVVTASYGTATAKLLEDRNEVDDDDNPLLDDNGNQIVTRGLKTIKKEIFDRQAAGLLAKYDWYIIRNTEASTAIPSSITEYRTAVRAKCNSMQVQIDNASDVDELAALYAYVNTGTEESPVMEKPLGEWPTDPNNND
jgi:hypothetical protein